MRTFFAGVLTAVVPLAAVIAIDEKTPPSMHWETIAKNGRIQDLYPKLAPRIEARDHAIRAADEPFTAVFVECDCYRPSILHALSGGRYGRAATCNMYVVPTMQQAKPLMTLEKDEYNTALQQFRLHPKPGRDWTPPAPVMHG